MSGDRGPAVSVPAAVAAAHEFRDVRFTLIGRQPDLERELGSAFPSNVSCLFAADVVEMTDHPREALRRKKDSSMRLAADLEGAHARPRVGLLNIGEEEIKGNDTVQAAHNLLTASDLNYVGFVEGHDIFSDKVDVVVTDGFTGNVALKAMEGAARLIGEIMREEL